MSDSRVGKKRSVEEVAFAAFVRESQDSIRHALVAGFGVEVGRDAAEDALVHAWRHWDRVSGVSNPAGYVYRVGHRIAQKMKRNQTRPVVFPGADSIVNPVEVEPGLPAALAALSPRQRAVVVTVSGYGFTQEQTADLLGISRSSVQRHLERGLSHLRTSLGATDHD